MPGELVLFQSVVTQKLLETCDFIEHVRSRDNYFIKLHQIYESWNIEIILSYQRTRGERKPQFRYSLPYPYPPFEPPFPPTPSLPCRLALSTFVIGFSWRNSKHKNSSSELASCLAFLGLKAILAMLIIEKIFLLSLGRTNGPRDLYDSEWK